MFKATAFVLGAALALVSGVAQAKPKPKQAEINGTISAISAPTTSTPGRITITGKTTATLNVVAGTQIEVNDRNGSFTDLAVGQTAEAKYDPATLNASKIEVNSDNENEDAHAVGTVLSASADSITLDTNGDSVADLTLSVTPQTKIEADDVALTPSQLASLVGARVNVEYLTGTFVAKEIEVDERALTTVTGTVTAVDANAGTITIQSGGVTRTFNVAPNAIIRIGNTTGALANVQVGQTVQLVSLGTDASATVIRVSVSSQQLKATGVLTAVSGNSVTLRLQNGSTLTLTVNAGTSARLNGKSVTLAQLTAALNQATQAGQTLNVTVQYDAATMVASKVEVSGNQERELRAIGTVLSASATALTLDTNGDNTADLTLTINPQTKITVAGVTLTPSQLASLVGVRVAAEYSSTTLVARSIEVDERALITVTGTVTAVDANAGTITLQSGGVTRTFTVSPNAIIRIGNTTGTLADVLVGDTVRLVTLGTGANALALRIDVSVQRLNAQGNLTAVSGNTITLQLRNGTSLTLTVDAGTDLRINGKVATLAQLTSALNQATQAGRAIKVSAQYVSRGGVNTALQLRVNVNGRGF